MDDRLLAQPALNDAPGLRDHCLERLAALAIRQAATDQPDERRALGLALHSTFRDCADRGLTEQARRLIQFVRTTFEPVEVGGEGDEVAA